MDKVEYLHVLKKIATQLVIARSLIDKVAIEHDKLYKLITEEEEQCSKK